VPDSDESLPDKPLYRQRLILLVGVMAGLLIYEPGLRRKFAVAAVIRSPTPEPSELTALVARSPDPAKVLRRVWDSGRIPHRRQIGALLRRRTEPTPWLANLEALLSEATRDPDLETRLSAFAVLRRNGSDNVTGLARALLTDADPEVRMIGLDNLVAPPGPEDMTAVYSLLEHPDSRVKTRAASILRRWTGNDSGVRGSISRRAEPEARKEFLATLDKGLERWRAWRSEHSDQFSDRTFVRIGPPAALPGPPVEFALPDLDGRLISARDFRGRVVLLNFWATWCHSCLAEIPDLTELSRTAGTNLVVIGISLDGVPDDHDHGNEGEAESQAEHSHNHGHEHEAAAARPKLRRVVKERAIPYLILHDITGEVAEMFLGGELPSNVLLDSTGRVRRRFMGGRSVAAFTEMAKELGKTP
jgi:thiol-disulfide isomerase/thioredoxin